MAENPLGERGRSIEDDYFRKRDQELIEQMRRAAAADHARQQMVGKTGLADPELLQELQDLGFTPDTIGLLPLVPVVQVAWAEGGITREERSLLVRLARSRGVEEGSAADRQLAAWMASRPDDRLFRRAGHFIQALLAAGSEETRALSADDLVRHCEAIAAASGGLFGFGRISSAERALLSAIAADLKVRQP